MKRILLFLLLFVSAITFSDTLKSNQIEKEKPKIKGCLFISKT